MMCRYLVRCLFCGKISCFFMCGRVRTRTSLFLYGYHSCHKSCTVTQSRRNCCCYYSGVAVGGWFTQVFRLLLGCVASLANFVGPAVHSMPDELASDGAGCWC
ncbi:unnamed protein product [Ectocarpus sp. 12 AP-2014]